jgi:sulfate/thiosulfate transport system permease protein
MSALSSDPRSAQEPNASMYAAAPLPWARWSLTSLALLYLTVMLLIPLGALVRDGLHAGLGELWRAISLPIARTALLLTLWTAGAMAGINAVMGTLTAYVLVRYRFPGRALLNAMVDMPLAIPTLVTGVMLVLLFGPQEVVGAWLGQHLGLRLIFAPSGIILALLFITYPLVVRAVQPVLESVDREPEAAAATLGASSWRIFWQITFPTLFPAIASGSLLSFARGVGEFGAVVLVAGNIPFHTLTAAVYVLGEIESQDQLGASAMSLAMLTIAFVVIVAVDILQRRGWGRTAGA